MSKTQIGPDNFSVMPVPQTTSAGLISQARARWLNKYRLDLLSSGSIRSGAIRAFKNSPLRAGQSR
jgi:hypothetical protein